MQDGWMAELTNLPVLMIGAVTFLAMLLGAAVGQLLRIWKARRAQAKGEESGESVAQEGYLHGSALGLLGLLLAFSFGMVINRFEDRRDLVVKEANAIGTAYLRTQFLDEPHRTALSKLLVDYTDNKIKLATATGDTEAYQARNSQLLTEIWAQVRAARESAQAHGMTTVLLNTYNDVIDLDTERRLGWELRLPEGVLLMLLSYLVIMAGVASYQINGPRGRRAALLLFFLLALSLAFITDINRPMSGQARESQKPMIWLLESMRAQPPEVFDRAATEGGEAPR